MIFGPKTLKNCFKDPEMYTLSESIGLYTKMKSKWCYLEYFYEILGIFTPKIAFFAKNCAFVKKHKKLMQIHSFQQNWPQISTNHLCMVLQKRYVQFFDILIFLPFFCPQK